MPAKTRLLSIFVVLILAAGAAFGQQVSGSITGVVKDRQGAVVPNAKITVIDQSRGVSREVTTGQDGTFFVGPLQPASYTVTVEASGFKKYEHREVRLFANDRMGLGDLVLEVGQLTETITVEASAVQLQTQSAERSGVVTGQQVANLALNGRNFLALVALVPGVVSFFNTQVASPGIGGIFVNGTRSNQSFVTLDGVSNMDTGSNGTMHTALNIDLIAEFKVITNSQQAEFGRSSGASINVVSKSGTRDFHGVGYFFHRHDGLNANNWRNNFEGRARQLYRYNYQGYNIGGPVYIPGKFNKDKDKLFFFWGQEWQEQLIPNGLRTVTVPTAEQRRGDFSRTVEAGGTPVTILDPLNSRQPFPGNIIPANRLNADGQRILGFYPLPNVTNPPPNFNYTSQASGSYPRQQMMARGDYNLNQNWRLFARVIRDADSQDMPYGQWSADYNVPFGAMRFGQPGRSSILNLTTIINPTLTNEFIFGHSKNRLTIDPVNDAFSRTRLGLQFRMPYPSASPVDLVPNFQFDVPNAPFSGFNGTPFRNVNHTFDVTDNWSKAFSKHTLKFGIFVQRSRKDQTAFTPANGTINFNRDANNPGDTGWAFSNAMLGNFRTFQQSNIVRNGLYRYTNVEAYIQDNWKARPNLTFDYGIRFYIIQPQYDADLQTSSFNPDFFTRENQAFLFGRGVNPASNRVEARNPLTGEFRPAALIGALVPGVGSFANGMAQAGLSGYPRGLIDSRGVHYGPRVGMAWSPEWARGGVLRMGAGIFYDRFQGNPVFDMLPNPPSTLSPTIFYGNISTAADTPGVLFPANVRGFSKAGQVPSTYNWNVSVQKEIRHKVLLDVAYVGSVSRHLLNTFQLNNAPFGSAWLPQNQDPTLGAPRLDGTTTLPVNFYRPFIGFANIQLTQFDSTSNYNSLQISANRRMATGLTFGLAYTWSKALGTASGDGDGFHNLNAKMGNYGPLSFDVPHNLVFNYLYDVPKPARNGNFLDNPVGRAIFNGWVVTGITTMRSGQPGGVGYSVRGLGGAEVNRRITGSETWGPRVVLNSSPVLSSGQRNENQWLRTDVYRPAVRGSVGLDSAIRGYLYGIGDHNWDVTVMKNIPLSRGDVTRYLQLRLEMFNAFNLVRYSGFNTGVQFNGLNDPTITNLPTALGGGGGRFGFGSIGGTRDPRIIELAAKIYF